MRKFAELDETLAQPVSVDTWSDYLAGVAQGIVQGFTAADWDELSRSWRDRPPEWRHRLAEVLSWGDPERALPLYAAMLASDDLDLVVAAADNVRNLGPDVAPDVLAPEIRARLASLADARGGLEAMVVRELLKMRPPSGGPGAG